MKKNLFVKALSLIICVLLIAAVAVLASGCEKTDVPPVTSSDSAKTVVGEGEKVFDFTVVGTDGVSKTYEVHTDKTIVGEALQELSLIAGEDSEFGLYVKTVDGITLDFDKDGKYWAFYVNGSYAMSGVDTTEIKDGEVYSFKAE
jgi:hypothetical protein